ncbi:hypothetical protein CQ12_25820 [Bradyrhizobium jicamae]|uniref:Uncharacterized protein n=1 Tax=Bradyrhizobium jicamae TaxID=280332 RepID=A0A0R3KF51_9BRAD|nr:hypothetical protein [Bradyrhizobium jicamae]KRQ94208.1 hypothetical protein CQ12_25820 [Bradyrhizobium jicamae]
MKNILILVGILLASLLAPKAEAAVLRSKLSSPNVWVFKDSDALSHFERIAQGGAPDETAVAPLLACKTPQGSKITVFSRGDLTAFVRVIEGSAKGCEGTVPLGFVQDK